jgi:predicted patatin/cPLA2 family phospholipase
MKPPKTPDRQSTRPAVAATTVTTASTSPSTRKAWKKKTPVEVVLDQINKVKEDVAAKEEAYQEAKRQLAKLEEARKILEAT